MPDDGEKFPLSERILQAFTALSHWARIGESGCGKPLTWVKVVVLLLVVVLCPLFFLPIVLVRLAHTGRTGFRYGVAIRTTGHRVRVLQGRTADALGPVAARQRHRGGRVSPRSGRSPSSGPWWRQGP